MADTSKSAAAPTGSPSSTGSQPDPLIGRTINDRFRILQMIARGGMGKVYKAEQSPLGRICAVKVLNPNYAGDSDPEFHKRFFLEASIASKLSHPNTVTVFDYGRTDDDVYYMAMEYLEGRTLHRLIREFAPLDPRRVLHITRQICRSLREAHGLGVIHRDLKPANIFLINSDEENDFVKVLDFGLVKNVDDTGENLTQTGLFMGSPKYMAPEQIRGEKVTARTDVYALGVVMYEMLTGKVPFDRGNSVNTLMAHVSEPVPPMREQAPTAVIPAVVEEIVYTCLQKVAEDRYASMDELLAAIKRAGATVFGDPAAAMTGEFSGSVAIGSGEIAARASGVQFGGPGGSHDATHDIAQGSGPMGSSGPSMRAPSPSGSQRLGDPLGVSNTNVLAPVSLEAPAPASRKGLWLGVLSALIVAGGAIAMFARPGAPTTATTPASVTAPSNAVPTPAPPAVHVALDSSPPNAEVLEGGTSLGHTPLRVEWTGAQGDPNRSHTFTFRLANYQDAIVTLSGASLQHTAQLAPTPPAAPAEPTIATHATTPVRPTARTTGHPRPSGTGHSRPPPGYRGIDDW